MQPTNVSQDEDLIATILPVSEKIEKAASNGAEEVTVSEEFTGSIQASKTLLCRHSGPDPCL